MGDAVIICTTSCSSCTRCLRHSPINAYGQPMTWPHAFSSVVPPHPQYSCGRASSSSPSSRRTSPPSHQSLQQLALLPLKSRARMLLPWISQTFSRSSPSLPVSRPCSLLQFSWGPPSLRTPYPPFSWCLSASSSSRLVLPLSCASLVQPSSESRSLLSASLQRRRST